jgi:peptide/nickel transport system permease protein
VPLGVLAAYKQGTVIDKIVMGFSVLGFSVPVFVIGYSLIYLFAIKLNWSRCKAISASATASAASCSA